MFKKLVIAALVASAEAVQIREQNQQQAVVEAQQQQQWGFLKNIVNIDRFFDSGVKA